MKKLILLTLSFMTLSCVATIHDKAAKQLEERSGWLPSRSLATSPQEQQAMDFLYAYMPMGDVYDFDEQLYLTNVQSSLEAMQEMSWSDSISEDLFYHFILPPRINNENLDTSRVDFFNELKDRVNGMTMQDAILEVNHWCHEKVVYVPSDGRTSSPSATVRSASGRCGEESTFTVAALRAVGIPARQIYTPRWAHTDDNHAWVEAWANGEWYYIGACEPEPILNTGWFDAPAKRSMLMFTKVFGDYQGEEEIIERTNHYTEINVTENYAPVKTQTTTIVDTDGNPVEGADISYTIYNYAQLYPAVVKKSDAQGEATFTTGKGDMTVFATKDGVYGLSKIGSNDTVVTVILDKTHDDVYNFELDITAPIELPVNKIITKEQRAENNRRFAEEDSIRNVYVETFVTKQESDKLATSLKLNKTRMWNALNGSRGNHAEIKAFLTQTPTPQRGSALNLLEVISAKDLRDTPSSVLADHLSGSIEYSSNSLYVDYILNPRIDQELLTPFRDYFNTPLTLEEVFAKTDAISLRPELNPAKLRMSVISVDKLQMSDTPALERYAISLLRTNGVPARREPITEKPQYHNGTEWIYIPFAQITTDNTTPQSKGRLVVTLENKDENPKYYTHFTLSKLDNGTFYPLDMSHSVAADMGAGVSYKTLFSKSLELEAGTYKLLTGTRMADGGVAVQGEVFKIEPNKTTTIPMIIRKNTNKLNVIGKFNPESLYIPAHSDKATSLLSTTGRGYYILALIDAKKEPTTHFLRGLESINSTLTKWDRPIVLVLSDKSKLNHFKLSDFPGLPKTVHYGYDDDTKTWDMMHQMLELKDNTPLPIVIVGDTFGRVVYLSKGYNTSIGEQLKGVIGNL